MKRHISFWGLFSFLWIFIACTQINSPSEENYSDTNNSSSKTEYCTFTLSVSKDSAVRVVYPSAYDTSTLYYKFSYLDADSNNTNYPADGSGATYTQISTKTFTLATGNYVFALDAYSDSACSKKILECTKNVTLSASSSSVPLKLKSTDAGSDSSATGSVSIKVNLPSSSTVSKVAVKVVNLTDTSSSVDSKELTPDESGTSKSVTYTNASLPTGNYIIYFTLSGNGIEETVIPELVVVATGQQSSNADSPIEVSEDQVNTNIIYVSSSGTTSGVGTKSNPFNTVEKALNLINSKNKTETDWAICISGSMACSDTLTVSSTLKAKSLVIFGTTDTSTDCLVGNGSQTTLALENEIPVTITNLCITGGGMGGIAIRGGGKVDIVGSAVTGCEQSGIRIASFSSSDVEIKESIIGGDGTDGNKGVSGGGISKEGSGSLTITDSTVKGNQSTSDLTTAGGGGIYVAGGSLILDDKTNIVENSVKLNGGGIFVKDGSVKIKGKVTIKDNTKASGTTSVSNNVYLASDKLLTLAASLSDTGSIGISTASIPTKALPVVLTSGLATYGSSLDIAKVFHSDLEEYEIKKNTDGEAILTPAEPLVSVAGTVYYRRESAVNAIKDASGEIEVVLLGGTSAADLGSAPTAGTIANAIKTTSASTVTFSIAEGVTITFDDTKNKQLFDGCSKLVSADLRGLDTSNMTLMYRMFADCSKLTSVNLSGFDTSKMTNFVATFLNCFKLTILDLSSFDTAEMSGMNSTFSSCSRLTTIIVSEKFVNTGVTNPTTGPFEGCTSLVGGKGTVYNSEHTDYTYARIDGGTANPGYFTKILIGTKTKPYAVGDIVFTDGSATPYSAGLTLTTTQKNAAIAVIFYVGTELNNGTDTTTTRTLGVGLVQDNSKVWCLGTASAYNIDVENLHCIGAFGGTSQKFTYPFTGVKNGSNALDLISSFLTSQGLTDDTATEANYPAFYFAKNYKSQTNSHVSGTSYEDGWYLPTIAELYWIYKAWTEVDSAMEACGGTKFNGTYATCTQLQSSTTGGYYFYFYPGNTANCVAWNNGGKNNARIPCAIREF